MLVFQLKEPTCNAQFNFCIPLFSLAVLKTLLQEPKTKLSKIKKRTISPTSSRHAHNAHLFSFSEVPAGRKTLSPVYQEPVSQTRLNLADKAESQPEVHPHPLLRKQESPSKALPSARTRHFPSASREKHSSHSTRPVKRAFAKKTLRGAFLRSA